MKPIFFLIPLLLILSISLIPDSFSETIKGKNYDDQLLSINPDGSETRKFIPTNERILINDVWQDSRYTNFDDYHLLETGHGTIKLNKSSCSFEFYKKGIYDINDNYLFSDSIVSKMANNGTEIWNEITQISNAICETYGSDSQLVAKKYTANVGFIEYKYINTGSSFKTQLEATNLSSQTNKKFGFTQTIDLNRDIIQFGNSQKNLDNFSGQTFDRTWLNNNKAKVINFLNNISFDLDIAFDNLESVYILDTGNNKSKISFNYLRNSIVILPNETLIIDPTYSSNNPTLDGHIWDNDGSDSCDASPSVFGDTTSATTIDVGSLDTGAGADCFRGYIQWDITSIPNNAVITDVIFKFDVVSVSASPIAVDVRHMTNQPSITSIANIWTDIADGTAYLTNDSTFTTTGDNKSVDLGTTADTDVQTALTTDWFAIGLKGNTEPVGASERKIVIGSEEDGSATPKPTLEITYTTTPNPDKVTDLTSTSLTQTTASLDWTAPYSGSATQNIIGYQINVTTPQTSNPLVFLNDTGSTNSDYIVTGLTLGTSYSARVSAWTNNTNDHPFNNATGNVYNFTTTTFIIPSAPTLSALSESETSVRFISINGTTGDYNMFYYGLRCVENGIGSWVTIVSNSTTPDPRVYSYTLSPGDNVTCQWRDGSLAGFGAWSNNATETTGSIGIIQAPRGDHDDKLMDFVTWIEDEGGLYFGLGVFPMVIMIIGFMATKGTVRIFTLISLMSMGIIHASGYFEYPAWYWTLAILFGLVLVLGRQARD